MSQNVFWGVHGALNAGVNGDVVMVGDSWFWYPIDNLATELASKFSGSTFVVIGKNGAEADEWGTSLRKDIDFGFKMYAKDSKALVLSGGGNDIAGMRDFLRLLKDDCSSAKSVASCFKEGQPDALLSRIISAYREVIIRYRAYNSSAPVISHNYDYAWPTGKGFFGPADWLNAPLEKAQVPRTLQRKLVCDLLDMLGAAQIQLASETVVGTFIPIKTTGTMPEDEQVWANELHPTPKGFKLIARKVIAPVLKPFL